MDTLTIRVKTDMSAVVAAERELVVFEKSVNSVNVSFKQTQKQWSDWANITTAVSTAFKAIHLGITNFIIAPLSSAVNGFMALGDQISKTSQRIGIGVEILGGFGTMQCKLPEPHGRNIANFYHRCGVPLFCIKKAGIMEFIH